MDRDKWDRRFLILAEYISSFSKDPTTKVGAVATFDKHIVSTGYNGFPINVPDNPEDYNNREIKLQRIIHAEINCILNNKSAVQPNCIFIFPMPPCINCSKLIIQSGIARVVSYKSRIPERWKEDIEASLNLLNIANVEVTLY